MRYVKKISDEDKLILEKMKKSHPNYQSRVRAHAILLSYEGMGVQELSAVFSVCRQTTTRWLRGWETNGINALYDKPRSGRPRNVLAKRSINAETRT